MVHEREREKSFFIVDGRKVNRKLRAMKFSNESHRSGNNNREPNRRLSITSQDINV